MRKQEFEKRIEIAGLRIAEAGSSHQSAALVGTNLRAAPTVSAKQIRELESALGLTAKLQPIGSELYASVQTLTPQLALDWLTTRNGANRDPSRAQYEGIQRDIEAGAWLLTHQGVAFDSAGQLIDGQHRLFAVLESGRSVLSIVVVNVPREAVPVMDRHRARRARDLLEFMGSRMSSFHESVIRRAMLGVRGSGSVVTIPQIMAFLDEHRAQLEWAMEQFPRRISGVVVAPLVASVFRARLHVTSDTMGRLEKFCQVMNTSVAEGDQDRAAILLRDWLISPGRSTRKTASGEDVYARCTRAIQAFITMEPLSRLYAASTELYPLPQRGVGSE